MIKLHLVYIRLVLLFDKLFYFFYMIWFFIKDEITSSNYMGQYFLFSSYKQHWLILIKPHYNCLGRTISHLNKVCKSIEWSNIHPCVWFEKKNLPSGLRRGRTLKSASPYPKLKGRYRIECSPNIVAFR